MGSLLQYGSSQNGRDMRKQDREELILKSFKKTEKALKIAQQVAEYNKDIEALVIISERWMQLVQHLKSFDKTNQHVLGFSPMPQEELND